MNQLPRSAVYSILRHAARSAFNTPQKTLWDLNIVPINRCNQSCPHCNAGILSQPDSYCLSLSSFHKIVKIFRPYKVPVCTISGGEPTLVPEMPSILVAASKAFPLKVMLITNLFGTWNKIEESIEAALQTGTHVVCSFDGFGEVADRMRGANRVSERVSQNLQSLMSRHAQIQSRSNIEIHTVISDQNMHQIEDLLSFSKALGVSHSFAPINRQPQSTSPGPGDGLHFSPELEGCVDLIRMAPHVLQLDSFLEGIKTYVLGQSPKLCPYKSRVLGRFKIFVEPTGVISMCDRVALGNIFNSDLDSILSNSNTMAFLDRADKCAGCWLGCFVEPVLATRPKGAFEALQYRFAI